MTKLHGLIFTLLFHAALFSARAEQFVKANDLSADQIQSAFADLLLHSASEDQVALFMQNPYLYSDADLRAFIKGTDEYKSLNASTGIVPTVATVITDVAPPPPPFVPVSSESLDEQYLSLQLMFYDDLVGNCIRGSDAACDEVAMNDPSLSWGLGYGDDYGYGASALYGYGSGSGSGNGYGYDESATKSSARATVEDLLDRASRGVRSFSYSDWNLPARWFE